jgi:RND family efflux transporter MFP subunit
MSQRTRTILKYGLPVVVLLGGLFATWRLIARRDEPKREETEARTVTVETQRVSRKPHRLDVEASGTVVPAREVTVQPQVGGEIEAIHPQLVSGGLVEKGEVLFQIEREDYRLQVQQRKSALEQVRAQLNIEKGQQEVAEREWRLFQKEAPDAAEGLDPSLALRKPQLENIRAQVEAAKAQLEAAQLNLKRTTVRAPFDALVRNESVDVGQVVGTQTRAATLVGTDRFRVQLSLPSNKIPYVDIPGVNAEEGSEATVRYELGPETTITRKGRVVRLLGDLDPQGRMARLLVEIEDPFGLSSKDERPEKARGIPLLLDTYVQVELQGNQKEELVEIPRRALRDQNQVYVFDDGTLAIRSVEIAWQRPQHVLVRAGLEEGERIVTGPLPAPVEGMQLRRADATGDDGAPPSETSESDSSNGASDE